MTDDDLTALTLVLDQLNGERAVLKDGTASLTISRAAWDELGRPAALQVLLNTDRP